MPDNLDNQNDLTGNERYRTIAFLMILAVFSVVSPFCGGFHNKIWSTLDSAFLIVAIGLTGLALVLETRNSRRKAFKVAIVMYILGVIDMAINVLITGWIGWSK